jgi:ferredoxin--NADP+ reductase
VSEPVISRKPARDHDTFFDVRITRRLDVTPDLWIIRVERPAEFHFVAGQYATLGVAAGEGFIERAYSIASSPYDNELEFFLELVPQGELTPLLHRLKSGDSLVCRTVPKGRFTLNTGGGPTHHLLTCTVTGVAPFVSYARTLLTDWHAGRFKGDHQLYLIQGASESPQFGYRAEFEQIANDVPWFMYVPTISRPWDDSQWQGETGRVDDVLRKYADQWLLAPNNTIAYFCGHPEMIEHGKAILHRRGWTKEGVREELYFAHEPSHA